LDLLSEQTVEVVEVLANSPAAMAGMLPGDCIVAAAGRIVSSTDDLHRVLATLPANHRVTIEVVRNEIRVELMVMAS
jgi:S1-C subfamily serine protease